MFEQMLLVGVIWYVVFVLSTTIHEAAHALAALFLGDPTGYRGGQVTLDPTPHMQREPIGMIVVPIASFILFNGRWMMGWASCPYDPSWAMAHPKRAGLMALAGPVSNALLCVVAAIGLRIGLSTGYFGMPAAFDFAHIVSGSDSPGSEGIAVFASVMFTLNLVLMVFNLFPMPPLDGSAVMMIFLPHNMARRVQEFLWDPTYQLLGLIATMALAPEAIRYVLSPAVEWVWMGALPP